MDPVVHGRSVGEFQQLDLRCDTYGGRVVPRQHIVLQDKPVLDPAFSARRLLAKSTRFEHLILYRRVRACE